MENQMNAIEIVCRICEKKRNPGPMRSLDFNEIRKYQLYTLSISKISTLITRNYLVLANINEIKKYLSIISIKGKYKQALHNVYKLN